MHFVTHFTIALISLITIVLSCVLFTNAIEFLGNKLKLGNNATGSILAVIGTGLPELVVPIIAILGINFSNLKVDVAHEIALGAILGSPFMLSTLALFLLGIVLIFKKRNILLVDYEVVLRDYKYFILSYFIAILFSLKFLNEYKILACVLLVGVYFLFVYKTIVKSRKVCVECECEELYFSKIKLSENICLFLQLILSLSVLILSSHFFVNEIKYFSFVFNISPAILSFLIVPFATELPECINSVIWLKQNKDDLAIANVLGAVVFQTTLLFSIGIILTPWVLNQALLINSVIAIIGAVIFILLTFKNKRINLFSLLLCGALYFLYLIILFIK